jgi:RNA polymerase sigma factor (sigma-70 family)
VDVPDAAAFEAFYRENLARIVRACLLVTLDRAAAEDIAQEAFARTWSRWGAIHGPDHAGGFVFKTAMRLCRRRRPMPIGEPPASIDEQEAAAERTDVFAALGRLPMRQRQSVVLRDWAGFETREVARMLGMRESTVRVHLARGRASLREALSVEEKR